MKFIHAKKDLSVPMHVDDEHSREYEHQNDKTKRWHVINTDEGVSLIYGVNTLRLKEYR